MSLSPTCITSSGVTGEISRRPRTTSTKNKESKFLRPFSSTLLPTNLEWVEISASTKYSLFLSANTFISGKELIRRKIINKQKTKATTPTKVKSKKPKLFCPCSIHKLLTIRLVEVPTSVNVPPKIAAKESGNNNLPGLTKVFFLIVPINVATTAVLLINADASAEQPSVLNISFF